MNAPHGRSDAQDDLDGVPHVSVDYGFIVEMDPEEHVSPVLVIRERRLKMTWAMLVPRKGTESPWIAKRVPRFIDQLGHNTVTLRCDDEPAIEALAREIGQARQEGSQRDHQWEKASPMGSSNVQWDSWLARSEN